MSSTTDAIDSVYAHANPKFKIEAMATATILARLKKPFTSADVLSLLEATGTTTKDNRALGGTFVSLSKQGLIKPTGEYVLSTRRKAHRRPMRVWVGTI